MNDDEPAVLRRWLEDSRHGVTIAVSTRHGGVSTGPYASLNLGLHVGDDPEHVVANRGRTARALGAELGDLVFGQQVHGVGASVATTDERGRGATVHDDAVPSTDILVTTTPGLVLVTLVADCVPLALVDPVARVLATVHAGWRGTAGGVVGRALDAMAAQGGEPHRVLAYIGPAVAADRYQVGDEVHAGLTGAIGPHPLHPAVARPDGEGHWLVDLVAANRQQLELGGVAPSNIATSPATTTDQDYFSDRAARPCGRFAVLARLEA